MPPLTNNQGRFCCCQAERQSEMAGRIPAPRSSEWISNAQSGTLALFR